MHRPPPGYAGTYYPTTPPTIRIVNPPSFTLTRQPRSLVFWAAEGEPEPVLYQRNAMGFADAPVARRARIEPRRGHCADVKAVRFHADGSAELVLSFATANSDDEQAVIVTEIIGMEDVEQSWFGRPGAYR